MQTARRTVQVGFLALALAGVFLLSANVERWCPLGGVEALYTYLREGNLVCSLGVSNFYILGAVLLTVLLLRRAFCSFVCPIGTISEWLGAIARRVGLRPLHVPSWLDRMLSIVKYVVLAVILMATWKLGELVFRGYCPFYALTSRHGADITVWAYVVAGTIALVSLVVAVPFCRWCCPLAAVLNPLSRFGLARIKRQASACSDCGRCAASCPMAIPVDRVQQVTASRCTACLVCMEACPRKKQNAISWGPPDWLGLAWPRAALIGILLLCASAGVAASYLAPLPSFVKSRGTAPDHVASVELSIRELTCRGRANLLVGFLERGDLDRIPGPTSDAPGYYKLEAWPDPVLATVRISYDPAFATEDAIKRAITEPYFDSEENRWWLSPFVVDGYAPPGLEDNSQHAR
jgi:polyferredoxin